MNTQDPKPETGLSPITRRDFMKTAVATSAGAVLSTAVFAQDKPTTPTQERAKPATKDKPTTPTAPAKPAKPVAEVRIALLGAGSQGMVLLNAMLKIPGVRFMAVCDIWNYSQSYSSKTLAKYDQKVNVYEDYRQMLEKEGKNLDAVVIATPDWMHAEHAIACLKAGLHVYCEKEMSNDLAKAKEMVLTARSTGKLLQIGHQRRSNPWYLHGLKLIDNDKVLGRITTINGQWNRGIAASQPLDWNKKFTLTPEFLKKWGYDNMDQFRNWRWYKKYAGGPIVDLGSHQIDVFSWYLKANPTAVMASGAADYFKDGRQWYNNVMAIYEYQTPAGMVQAFYQVNNTTSYGDFYESFMGDEGSLVISEDIRKGLMMREPQAKTRQWEDMSEKVDKMGKEAIELKIGETRTATGEKPTEVLKAEADMSKPPHQPHLENFFDAVRDGKKLNCPAEAAYETAVMVLKVNDAIAAGKKLEFKPEEFKA